MHTLDLKFAGAVFDLKIDLEGREVGLLFDGVSEWTRRLETFNIEDKLDLVMLCKGVNGTEWSLEITIDNKGPITYSGKIKKGYSLVFDEIEIPLET